MSNNFLYFIIEWAGYKYNYPFLSPECGILVENNHVKPLFKHILNIEHPSMYFIGIPTNTAGFYMFDLQVIKQLLFIIVP